MRNIDYVRQKSYPLIYKGIELENAYRVDFLVENEVVVELKAVENLTNLSMAQLITYIRLLNLNVGLLLNFNVPILKEGIKRVNLTPFLTYLTQNIHS